MLIINGNRPNSLLLATFEALFLTSLETRDRPSIDSTAVLC